MPLDEQERAKQIREYAWSWFSYHAAQRTNMFNYFLAAAAVLVAGFAAAAGSGARLLAGVIALVGAVISFFFMRLDARNEELVSFGKNALRAAERHLFQVPKRDGAAEAPGMTIRLGDVEFPAGIALEDARKEMPSPSFVESFQRGKHTVFLRLVEQTICGFFVLALGLAAFFPGGAEDKTRPEPGKVDVARLTERVDSLKAAIDNSAVNQQAAQDRLRASVSQTTTDLTTRLDELEEKLGHPRADGTARVATTAPKAGTKATRKRRGPTTR